MECTQSVKKKNLWCSLSRKKFVFQSEKSTYSLIIRLFYFQKIQKFYRVKELSKSNQTRYGVYHVYLERKTKRIFGIPCLQKRSFFNRKFRLIRLFYFQKYRTFIGSRSCPKGTKLGMECPMCTQSVKEKKIGIVCLGKSSYFNRKFRLTRLSYAYSIFKNIEFLSGQGVVQIEPNSLWSITCAPRV